MDAESRAVFATWTPPAEADSTAPPVRHRRSAALHLAVGAVEPGPVDPPLRAPRRQTRSARLGPARRPVADRRAHGVTDDDLRALPADVCRRPGRRGRGQRLRRDRSAAAVYCSTTGFDYAHVFVPEEREWLRSAVESGRFRAAGRSDRPRGAARSAHAGRSVRALPAPRPSPARRASRSKGST